jgi:2-polyprenyl-3-methyl-5-hydroxy-6-metoxy-1,4-benzoquinol methylase
MEAWKSFLYDRYVSSEQAGAGVDPQNPFRSQAVYVRHLIKKYIPTNKELSILDLGCGHGTYLYFLQEAGYRQIKGVDFSGEQVALAHQLGLHTVEQGNIFAYAGQLPNESVDIVLLFDVLEHLTRQELVDFLPDIARILKPGGQVVAHVPNGEGLFGMRIRYGDLTHEGCFTSSSARQLLRAVGFSQVRCMEDPPAPVGLKGILRWLSWQILVLPFRLMLLMETGARRALLSQNMIFIGEK